MADSLPGLGIVAAVLGVVITMGALGGPPEEIGHKVAAALVGTFLGILLCYGLVGPSPPTWPKLPRMNTPTYYVLRVLMISFMKGRAAHHGGGSRAPRDPRPRPSRFQGSGKTCRASGGGAAAEAGA